MARRPEWPKKEQRIIRIKDGRLFLERAREKGITTINIIANVGERVQIGTGDSSKVRQGHLGIEVVVSNQAQNEGYWDLTEEWEKMLRARREQNK